MATESSTTGNASPADGMSAAARLMKQHAADEAHQPTVEEVVDEEALAHPPPSAALNHESPAITSTAAGKQPIRENTKKPALDTQSEELFPALGGPKAKPTAAPTMWSKKPTAFGNVANGVPDSVANGHASAGAPSQRSPAPTSGVATPGAAATSNRGPTPQMSLPGRYSEQIQLHSSYMTPRSQLKKPVPDILRDINKRSKANVEMKTGQGGNFVFEGTGPVDAVRMALKDVANQLCAKVSSRICVNARN